MRNQNYACNIIIVRNTDVWNCISNNLKEKKYISTDRVHNTPKCVSFKEHTIYDPIWKFIVVQMIQYVEGYSIDLPADITCWQAMVKWLRGLAYLCSA